MKFSSAIPHQSPSLSIHRSFFYNALIYDGPLYIRSDFSKAIEFGQMDLGSALMNKKKRVTMKELQTNENASQDITGVLNIRLAGKSNVK